LAVGSLVFGLGMVLVLIHFDSPKLFFLPDVALIGISLSRFSK